MALAAKLLVAIILLLIVAAIVIGVGIWFEKQSGSSNGGGSNGGNNNVDCSTVPAPAKDGSELFIVQSTKKQGAVTAPYVGMQADADEVCAAVNGAKLATMKQLQQAQSAGAQWCAAGWIDDSNQLTYYAMFDSDPTNGDCGGTLAPGVIQQSAQDDDGNPSGVAVCYGERPAEKKNHVQVKLTGGATSAYPKGGTLSFEVVPFYQAINSTATNWSQESEYEALGCAGS